MRRVLPLSSAAVLLALLSPIVTSTLASATEAPPSVTAPAPSAPSGGSQPATAPSISAPSPQPTPSQTLAYRPTKPQYWKKPGISQVWPADKASLWVPAREGRYSTIKPVDATTVTARISGAGLEEELVRLTKGKDVTSVMFRMPNLTPGSYTITWNEGGTASVTTFEIQDPVLAPGGGNHRHEATVKATPWPQRISLAFVVLTGGVALLSLAGLWWIPLAVLSALGSIVALTASIGAFVSGYNMAGFGESAWAAGLASPGVWGYLLIALVMSIMPLTRSLPTSGRLGAVGILAALGAGAGHLHSAVPQSQTVAVSVLVGVAGAAAVASAITAIRPGAVVAIRDRVLIGAALAMAAFASVFIHSLFATPTGAYVDAYIVRAGAAAVLIAGLASIRPWGGSRLRGALSAIAVVAVVAAVVVLTQIPPLTAGL